jgi:mRNA-degrading endonuclease RelE of RelBE toxin-antitoxin system
MSGASASAITRVIYTINDATKTIDITRIAHRREVYD